MACFNGGRPKLGTRSNLRSKPAGCGRQISRPTENNAVLSNYPQTALAPTAPLGGGRTGDNAGMDAGELVANILDAIGSGRDLYLYDHYIIGPDARQRAREVLIEKRDACSDPDELVFLTSVIHGLEEGRG
jgi:hypothetical protein